MAFSFNEEVVKMEVSDEIIISDKDILSMESPLQNGESLIISEPMLTDSAEKDIFHSTDSLSSSTSFSDSDLTSTDSEDSLALSESESITDVTPLNSPYCDSPLPQSRIFDSKGEDKNVRIVARECPEMNVLKQAIEKLELEAKESDKQDGKVIYVKRRTKSQGNEDSKRIEQENQRLFKRVISRQNHRRTMSPTTNSPGKGHIVNKSQDNGKSDAEIRTSIASRTMDDISLAANKK